MFRGDFSAEGAVNPDIGVVVCPNVPLLGELNSCRTRFGSVVANENVALDAVSLGFDATGVVLCRIGLDGRRGVVICSVPGSSDISAGSSLKGVGSGSCEVIDDTDEIQGAWLEGRRRVDSSLGLLIDRYLTDVIFNVHNHIANS